MQNAHGYSLVELMISIALATLMSLGVVNIFINQTGTINTETQRDITLLGANQTFDTISRLLRQADKNSIRINYPANTELNTSNKPEIENDATVIDFLLPKGFNVWPNNKPPYINNAIRLSWNNFANDDDAYTIQIAKAENLDALSGKPLQTLAGDSSGEQARIVNFDIWPMRNQRTPQALFSAPANAGYLLSVTTRTAQADMSFINPVDPDGPLKHYRTNTASGIIFPRN